MNLELALDKLGLEASQVACVYLRGSRAVGTHGERLDGTKLISDWDLVIVLRTDTNLEVGINYGNLEAVLYDPRTF